jgi:antibiotic biosynthesis monooxygenase (ABM) superfamily enzyme
MKKLLFYLLYGIATPLIVIGLTNTRLFEDMGEAVRPDDYSMGTLYYLVLFGVLLLLNAVFVLLTKKFPPFKEFLVTFSMTVVVSLVGYLFIYLVAGLIFFGSMMSGHWNFG